MLRSNALLTFAMAVLSVGPVFAQAPVLRPTDNLIAEGIPDIPATLADEVRRYTEARSASFVSWHPEREEMLISTRFGNTNQIHEVRFPGGARRQLTFFNEPIAGAEWEPRDGKYFLFTRDTGGNEFGQLYRYDIESGNVSLLSDGGRSQNGGWVWNHAKNRVAYSSTRRNGADRDLWLLDPTSAESNKLLAELAGGGWAALDWSPDDAQILMGEYLSVTRSNLWIVNAASGEKRQLNDAAEEVSWGGGKFSPDGRGFYVTTDKDNEFKRLAYWNLESGKLEVLTDSIKWDVEGFDLSKDGKQICFLTNEAGVSKAYLMDTATKKIRSIEGLPQGVIGGGSWHENNRLIAFSVSSARSTSDIYSWDATSGEVKRWTESELGGLNPESLVEPELIRWNSFDGLEISGFYYPAAKKFTGRRPVIINIHGGPEGQSRPTFQGRNNFYMNELGVAMIYPNVRGSTGYGKTFVKLDNGILREDSVKDIGALLDWVATQPELDPTRVMVTGGSYGGYMTLAVATNYNNRVRCSLDVVGISHFATFLKNTESYRRDLRRVEYGDERDPVIAEFFEKIAPLNNASKITKPLFVVQGANDPRVPMSEAEQMVAKVRGNGGPVWYLNAKDEGHGFRKKGNADFQFFATVMFVRQHLLDEVQ
ncbi:MAG: prolyl oligopeptidase family serine peptidase [Planctomycetota bacterium]